jgi:hypothetical protein
MPCSSIYCLSNTGYPTFNDVYFSAGTHNSELYWTGQTNGLFIYYNTGTTQWCLSTALDGTCDLSGQSPCFNPCPDLDDVYFSSGTCPTPTPSPTQNCLSLNFTAFFDCDVPATPTPTPTITTSPTPTPTPSPTNLCNVVISATIQSVSPTPTPTPTITPSSSPVISRDCTFEQSVSFNTIEDSIVCPYSYQFQDCYNGKMYYTTNQIVTPTGNNITKFEVYRANVNEEIVCIHYVGVNNNTIGIDDITLISGPYGFSNLGDCIFCSQINTPTPTPTPTVTPSGMPSECITTCGLEGYAYTKT